MRGACTAGDRGCGAKSGATVPVVSPLAGAQRGAEFIDLGRAGGERFALRDPPRSGRWGGAAAGTGLMFFPEGQIRVHLYGQPCDMRKSFDGLHALVRQGLRRDPLDGALYVFINRRATQMRVLYFDRSGFCVWAKRLEAGRFVADWQQVRTREMDWTALKLMLEGIEPGKWRKRYRLTQDEKCQYQHGAFAIMLACRRRIRERRRARLRRPR